MRSVAPQQGRCALKDSAVFSVPTVTLSPVTGSFCAWRLASGAVDLNNHSMNHALASPRASH
jgi:hypothetical protein